MSVVRPSILLGAACGVLALASCSQLLDPAAPAPAQSDIEVSSEAASEILAMTPTTDAFSFANYNDVRVTHADLNLDVDFDNKVLDGTATLTLDRLNPAMMALVIDTRDLTIGSVMTFAGDQPEGAANFILGEPVEGLGQSLTIALTPDTDRVAIDYRTSPQAEGLQWLAPEQTAGKVHPYLFSQAQAINARTMAPLQDTSAVRMTYSATLRVPDGLRPLMSAEQGEKDANGEYHFNMPQPIPPYLLAIAVGDIKFNAISDHIGVYAEEYILDAAAEEFAETPLMEAAAEKFYGPYRWGRYDLIVLPPSFPYGGMENPRLSFMTPTLIAGDKSLTNVVAHELAHSWSGNLVTYSDLRDTWLNEGMTSYVENRIMEELYGRDRAVMEQVLAMDELTRSIAEAARPELTQLKLPADLGPGDSTSVVAYEKGQFFLQFLEERFGREEFDAFLKDYFDHFAFQSITTEDFIKYLHDNLHVTNPDALTRAELQEWIYQPGLPSFAPNPQSDAFDKVAAERAQWLAGEITTTDIPTDAWSTHEWLHFLNGLPGDMTVGQFSELDTAYGLTGTRNAETAFAWYMKAIEGGYSAVDPALEAFLINVGRGKFIYRLYQALEDTGRGDWAREVYARARPGYHPIAQTRIDGILLEE